MLHLHRSPVSAVGSGTWSWALALALTAAGCDRARVETSWEASPDPGLHLEGSNVSDGVHAGRGAICLTFDRPVDESSVGTRSVRVEREGGRRVRRVRVWASGRDVFVAPPPDRAFPADQDLTLRMEGGGSPRSVRAEDGSTLAASLALPFRILQRRRTDLEGPRLLFSEPDAGSTGAAPASHVQLVFDEPLARAPIRAGDAVSVRVNGVESPARLRLSPDLTRLVVRPQSHLPPGASVEVSVLPALLDLSGNPAEPVTVRFRTRATRLRELAEDFVTTDMRDVAGTTGGWAEPGSPGVLCARAGRVRRSAAEIDLWDDELPAAPRARFQVLFPAGDEPGGVGSALRLYLLGADDEDLVEGATIEIGPTQLARLDPTFEANRRASDLVLVTDTSDPLPVELDEAGAAYVDVPFDAPAPVRPSTSLLVDVQLALPAGVRVAAARDAGALSLVENLGVGVLVPAAELLVSGGPPQARSGWWDSGVERPGWHEAFVEGADRPGEDFVVEFQTAAATPDDRPDLDRASEWGPELARQPALRFVRFRVTFLRLGARGSAPRIDRIVLPYQE